MKWIKLFESLVKLLENEVAYLLYLLAVINLAMIIDVLFGTLAAKRMKLEVSKIGIDGMLRKAYSLFILLFSLTLIPIIPFQMGTVLVSLFYLNFLRLEILSIRETYAQINGEPGAELLEKLLAAVSKIIEDYYKSYFK